MLMVCHKNRALRGLNVKAGLSVFILAGTSRLKVVDPVTYTLKQSLEGTSTKHNNISSFFCFMFDILAAFEALRL